MPVKLIVNADDFGSSCGVNRAVRRAHRDGILTSASLMVTGDAFAEAISIAKDLPSLAVGLHLALSDARSALAREAVPDLVDAGSRFAPDPVRTALRYYFNRRCRMQLRMEIEAQFEAFAATGLELSHVDGHQHLHLHPAVLQTVVRLAVKHGAKGIRVPREPFWKSIRADRSRPVYKLVTALGHAYLRMRVPRGPHSIGALMSGRMTEEYVIRMLRGVTSGSVEVFFHPTEGEALDPFGPNPGDLDALLSPRLRRFILENGFELTTYAGLHRTEVSRELA